VDPADLAEMARLVPGPVETYLAPEVSHTLRRQPREASLRAYRREVLRPVDPEIVGRIVDWFGRYAHPAG
jgi:hypothetical protein